MFELDRPGVFPAAQCRARKRAARDFSLAKNAGLTGDVHLRLVGESWSNQ
jgi:hypothetical protein